MNLKKESDAIVNFMYYAYNFPSGYFEIGEKHPKVLPSFFLIWVDQEEDPTLDMHGENSPKLDSLGVHIYHKFRNLARAPHMNGTTALFKLFMELSSNWQREIADHIKETYQWDKIN